MVILGTYERPPHCKTSGGYTLRHVIIVGANSSPSVLRHVLLGRSNCQSNILLLFICCGPHPTMYSMSFNADHSKTFPEIRNQREITNETCAVILYIVPYLAQVINCYQLHNRCYFVLCLVRVSTEQISYLLLYAVPLFYR